MTFNKCTNCGYTDIRLEGTECPACSDGELW
jgi:predicted Zn-ribbon and HTH transcriptional regulator